VNKKRPIIGISTQTLHVIDGIPAALPQSVVMNQRYYTAVEQAGGAPVLIPLLADEEDALRTVYELCQGILIPGGVDMDPSFFGEDPHPELGRTDPARDRLELQLTRWCIQDRKPLLGLCRGLQVMNVALGGTLFQDLPSQRPEGIKHDYFPTYGFQRDHLAHDVALHDGTRLRSVMGRAEIAVNSMHHQGIKALAPALVSAATAPDGLIEAVESADGQFLVGVQWHPEVFEIANRPTGELFREFVRAAEAGREP
jgi:putative glutamine amidotransferase